MVRHQEWNPRPPALQSSALQTELTLLQLVKIQQGLVFIAQIANVI